MRGAAAEVRDWWRALGERRFTTLVALIGLFCLIAGAIGDDEQPANRAIGALGILIAIVGMAIAMWRPRPAVVIMLAGYLISENVPDTGFVFCKMTALVCALLVLGYVGRVWWRSLGVAVAITVLMLIRVFLETGAIYGLSEVMLSVSMCALPWAAGRAVSVQYREREAMATAYRLRAMEERLSRKNRDDRIARGIHDAVSNDLSQIIMIAGQHAQVGDCLEIVTRARDALNEVHRVIDLLDGAAELDGECPDDDDVGDIGDEVRRVCLRWDDELERRRLVGGATIMGRTCLDARRAECALAVIGEAYTNIVRHCTDGDEYSMIIRMDESGIRIIQSNSCRRGVTHLGGFESGRGLRLHRREVESLGGQLRTSYEDDTWMMHVRLPAVGPAGMLASAVPATAISEKGGTMDTRYHELSERELERCEGGRQYAWFYYPFVRLFS